MADYSDKSKELAGELRVKAESNIRKNAAARKARIGKKAQDFTHVPLRCKVFNHSYEIRYIDPLLDNPDVGMLICKRKYCGHIYMIWEDWK